MCNISFTASLVAYISDSVVLAAVTVCRLEFEWISPLTYIAYPDIDLDLCSAISGVENFDGRL